MAQIAHGIAQSANGYLAELTLDTTGANLVVVWVGSVTPGQDTSTLHDEISSTNNGTFAAGTDWHGSVMYGRFFYLWGSPTVGTGHRFYVDRGVQTFPMIEVWAYSDAVSASDPLDRQNGLADSSVSTIAPGSVTPTTPNQIVISAVVTSGINTYAISGGGFSTVTDSIVNNGSTGAGGAGAAIQQTTAGSTNPLWMFDIVQSEAVSAIITFKATSPPAATDRALNQPAVASSEFAPANAAGMAVDGDGGTYWSSVYSDPQWWYVDLGAKYDLSSIRITWTVAYATDYLIQVSDGGSTWTTISTLTGRTGGTETITVSGSGRYVSFYGTARGSAFGYAFESFEVFGELTTGPSLIVVPIAAGSLRFTTTYPRIAGAEPALRTLRFTGYAPTVNIVTSGLAAAVSGRSTLTGALTAAIRLAGFIRGSATIRGSLDAPIANYYQARSGVCRAGVTRIGWTPPIVMLKIANVDQTTKSMYNGFTLNVRADGAPSTLTFTLRGLTPTLGQEVSLFYTTPNDYLFGGTLLQIEAQTNSNNTAELWWHCTAVGYPWLLDRYARVNANYQSTGVNVVVPDILARCTNGNFRVGYCPESLGNITMGFTNATVVEAMNRIAKACSAFWEVVPFDGVTRIVNVYQTYPEQPPAVVTEANILRHEFSYSLDLTQVRTRVLFEGRGSSASAVTAGGSSTLPVDDLSPYSPTGGTVSVGYDILTYTGLSGTGGPGSLIGVSGLLNDVNVGDPVNIIAETVDAGAEAALAARLGGGLSGQATNFLQDGRLSNNEALARGATDLATFGQPLEEAHWTYTAIQRSLRVGQSVTVNVTSPVTVTGSFLAQAIQITPVGPFGGRYTGVYQTVVGNRFVRTVTDLLSQLAG